MAHDPQQQPQDDPELEAQDGQSSDAEASRPLSEQIAGAADASLIGQTLEGRYRFEALIGEGSFARVFKVYDMDRRVHLAAKVLRSDIADEPTFLARFKREAAVLASLQHPHIVRYYDTIESGDLVLILTDYIDGMTMQRWLRQQGGMVTPFDSLAFLRELAAALHFAHRQGVVHRDLKPANILIDSTNTVFITDFGIARILSDTSTLTVDTTVGTPHYMSPEQILANQVTEATDIYALGIMLFQMYTGQLPFMGESDTASGTTTAIRIVYEHLHVAPPRPTDINPRLSVAVERVILKCMAKDPAQRYDSISALYDALSDAIGTPSVSLDAASLGAAPDEKAPPSLAVPIPEPPQAERVPTGVGGMSRVVDREEYADDEFDAVEYIPAKPKRKPKPDSEEDPWDQIMGEKETEKQREKDRESAEKEREKGPEKGETFSDFGSNDQLAQISFGAIVVWVGVVWLVNFTGNNWGWSLAGAGAIILTEVAARLFVPRLRSRPGGRLVFGAVLLAWGLSILFSIGAWWAIILIAIGVSMLINRLTEGRD